MFFITLIFQAGLVLANQGRDELAQGHYLRAAEILANAVQELENDGGSRTTVAIVLNDEAEASGARVLTIRPNPSTCEPWLCYETNGRPNGN